MTNRDTCIKANHKEGMEIDREIRKERPDNEEIAILRKTLYAVIHGEPIPTEFEDYYTQAEQVKASVKARLNPS